MVYDIDVQTVEFRHSSSEFIYMYDTYLLKNDSKYENKFVFITVLQAIVFGV